MQGEQKKLTTKDAKGGLVRGCVALRCSPFQMLQTRFNRLFDVYPLILKTCGAPRTSHTGGLRLSADKLRGILTYC